jgi:hypothetical protein
LKYNGVKTGSLSIIKGGDSMKFLTKIFSIVLGLIFLSAGINGYLVLFGVEPIFPTSPQAEIFLGDGYFLALEKGVEIIGGLFLIIGRFQPLILLILAPIVVNILAFHIFVDLDLILLAIVVTILELFLLWANRAHYKGLLNHT